MKRLRHLFIIAAVLQLSLIASAFVTYVPMDGAQMQNIYITKILWHCIPTLVLVITIYIGTFFGNGSQNR